MQAETFTRSLGLLLSSRRGVLENDNLEYGGIVDWNFEVTA